jgi:protoheme ferro-lyase
MKYLLWFFTALFALLTGVFTIRYMTVHPLEMGLNLFILCVFMFITIILLTRFERRKLVFAIPLGLLAFAIGYLGTTYLFLSRDDPRPVPAITRALNDPGKGHTAIVYFTHGEPETYDPIGWINQFREFDEQNISFVPFFARPMFVYALREKYLEVGKSSHRQMHFRMLKSLERAYQAEGNNSLKFYISFLDDSPRPDAAVIQALNDGASRIIVSEVFLTISNHTAEGKELVKAVQAERYGATIKFTGPLWDSNALRSMFIQRANANIGNTPKSKVGILLVGHGQPDEWDKEFPTETEQETSFRQSILKSLEQDGYRKENLSLAWMEFKKPEPAEKVEEFARNGVDQVLYFAAAISAESIHSQSDIPELVHQAKIPSSISLVNLGAWDDDPIVIKAIKEKIDAQMSK